MRDAMTGKLMRAVAGEPGVHCEYCEVTPLQIQFTIAGLTVCPNCFPYLTNLSQRWTYSNDPNISFILTQTANPCVWQWYSADNEAGYYFKIRRYTDSADCTGYYYVPAPDRLLIQVQKVNATQATVQMRGVFTGYGGGYHGAFRNALYTVASGCVEASGLSNQLSCVPADWTQTSYGGIASIVEL